MRKNKNIILFIGFLYIAHYTFLFCVKNCFIFLISSGFNRKSIVIFFVSGFRDPNVNSLYKVSICRYLRPSVSVLALYNRKVYEVTHKSE